MNQGLHGRLWAIIQAEPDKDRIARIITRWLKRHLQRLGAEITLDQLNSLVEDKNMLAENLESWAQKERHQSIESTLRKQIILQFGELPKLANVHLQQACDTQRDTLVAEILTANSLDELFND